MDDPAILNLDDVRVDAAWALRIPASLALRKRLLPLSVLEGHLHVACEDVGDAASFEAVARFTGLPVRAVPADTASLGRALQRVYGDARKALAGPITRAGDGGEDAASLADELLRAAILRQASDIHIDPARDHVRVRLRVDGVLEDYHRLPATVLAPLTSRFKVLAGMDIAERRAPQDGAFVHPMQGGDTSRTLDVRAASLPTRFGERLTLRLLPTEENWLTLETLGLAAADLAAFHRTLDHPHGLVLLTGPTGGGKTTTLYAAIRRLLESAPLNIISVEDPIEYEIPGIAQVEVDSADKISFGKALRSLLRHDPDVLVIGEIRDRDSLDIAVKASLTGHLVFSTLHTNNAISAITRLVDMGMPAHLIAATLRLCLAQRLVRRLCPHCRRPVELSAGHAAALGIPESTGTRVYEPGACLYCSGRGFIGRMGIFERASLDAEVASLVARGAEEEALRFSLERKGFRSLLADGATKVLAGETTAREVLEAAADT